MYQTSLNKLDIISDPSKPTKMLQPPPHSRSSIPSSLVTQIPRLSAAQIAALPYPPDKFHGARDVATSYGSMRVYEWGNEAGRKIMLVHGDATCAPLWDGVAKRLIQRGCRVIVFDLWGRGYSDSPLVPLDGRMLALQLLFAASSSPLPWCSETFSIIGYSLGGGITMDFVASFPHLVRSVALLAPVGLLRSLPDSYVALQQAANDGKGEAELKEKAAVALGVDGEAGPPGDDAATNVAAIKRWQFEHHQGHATSFVSSLQYGPIQGQHEIWRKACEVLKAKQRADPSPQPEKLVVICGSEDGVVPAEHVKEDLDGMMGEGVSVFEDLPDEPLNTNSARVGGRGGYVFETVKGDHGFPLDEEACAGILEILGYEWALVGSSSGQRQ